MPRFALSVALALGLGSSAGCAVSASGSVGSAPGDRSQGAGPEGKPARVVEGSGAEAGAAEEGTAAAPSAPPACEPKLTSSSTALFGTRIMVRMPEGVELAEQNPFYARAVAPNQASNCGQPVSFVAVGFFEYPNAAVPAVRDLLLELRGLDPATLTWEDEGTRGRTYTGAYQAPADEATGAPATRGWFVLRDASDKYGYFALYEAEPAAWEALKGVFVASGRSLLIKQRPAAYAAEAQISAAPSTSGAAGEIASEPAGAKSGKTGSKSGSKSGAKAKAEAP